MTAGRAFPVRRIDDQMRTLGLLQARTSSTRLPGKVLKPILGTPMLRHQLDRIRRAKSIESLIVASESGPSLPVPVRVFDRDGTVTVEVAAGSGTADVWVLPVLRSHTVQIGRGENGGRTVSYANVVRAVVRVGEWNGTATRLEVPLATARGEADGYVVLLQTTHGTKPGRILGAAKGPGL